MNAYALEEKPPSLDSADRRPLGGLARAANLVPMVGHTFRSIRIASAKAANA